MRPMLSSPAPADFIALKYPLAAEIKYDGVRTIAVVNFNKCRLYSRNGKELFNFDEVRLATQKLGEGVYDGEVISPEGFQKLMTRTHADEGKNTEVPIEYKIFDKLTIDEWVAGKSLRDYTQRTIDAKIGERTIIKNHIDLDIYYNFILKQGHEGLILKELHSPYESGSKAYWIKVKPKDTLDMQIMAFNEGTDKCKGMLGSIQVVCEFEGHTVYSAVGTGFSDDERKDIWAKKEELIGKLIEVEFLEFTKANTKGELSLRSPVFKCLRLDK